MSLLKDHNTVTPVRLEPAASRSRVKHSTTEPLRPLKELSFYTLEIFIMGWSVILINRPNRGHLGGGGGGGMSFRTSQPYKIHILLHWLKGRIVYLILADFKGNIQSLVDHKINK